MKVGKQRDGWWILDLPAYRVDAATFTSCGPYCTSAEADEARRGLERCYRDHPPTSDAAVGTPAS
jgi:hypothetical protein